MGCLERTALHKRQTVTMKPVHMRADNQTPNRTKLGNGGRGQSIRARSQPGRTSAGLIVLLVGLIVAPARAADGTWIGKGAQAWGQAIWGGVANWVNGTVASGRDGTAFFGLSFDNGYRCIVNTARTIGHIRYNDPADANDFILARHGNDYSLTLDVSSGIPTINVTQPNRTLTIEVTVAGNDGLAKDGPGTLVLTRLNTYTGPTLVRAGTLKISTQGSISGPIAVASNAIFGVRVVPDSGGVVSIPGDLTFGDNSTLLIDYGSTTPGWWVPPLQVNNLAVGTNLTVRITADSYAGFFPGGAYALIAWRASGPADESAFPNLVVPPGMEASLFVFESVLYLDVINNAVGALSWNTGDGTWDTITPNWLDAAGLPATYKDGVDSVLFDDAEGVVGAPVITLHTTVSPLSVTMSSSSHDYTITGSGGIYGNASLTLDAANTRTLTLATANSYNNSTLVNGGVLRLGAAEVIPHGPGKGSVTINSPGLLDLNGFSETVNGLSGSGTVDNLADDPVTLTVGANNASSIFRGIIQNTAGTVNLVKIGTNAIMLSGPNTFTGTAAVRAGTLRLGQPAALATVSAIRVDGGAALSLEADGLVINASIAVGESGTTSRINAPPATSDTIAAATATLNAPITGAGNAAFYGINVRNCASTILLNAQSTYAGTTLITCDPNAYMGINCIVKLGTNNALPPTTVLTLDGLNGYTSDRVVRLDLNGFDQTLAGLTNVPRAQLRQQQVINSNPDRTATLTVSNVNDYAFTGVIGPVRYDNIALVKDGPGKFTLNPSTTNAQGQVQRNNYRGPTIVSDGILEVTTRQASLSGPVTVASRGAFSVRALAESAYLNVSDVSLQDHSTVVIDYGSTMPTVWVPPLQMDNLAVGTDLTVRVAADTDAAFSPGAVYALMAWRAGPDDQEAALAFSRLILPPGVEGSLSVLDGILYVEITGGPPPPPQPELSASALTMSPSGVPTFQVSTVPGYKYRLLYSDDVAKPLSAWQPVTPPAQGWVLATGTSLTLTDPAAVGQAQRFYILEVANP